jgi:predicted nuclease with TOPRIM domain
MSEKKTNFVTRVMNALKGGDEVKISKFQNEFIKSNNDQIAIREREMEDLRENLIDLNEQMDETVLGVNLDKIKDNTVRKQYVNEYRDALLSIIKNKKLINDKIDTLKEEVEAFKELNDAVK